MWIFGYGSLVWKADFPYELKLVGHIKGFVRRFWQGSEDHRGVPGQPGRVATLIPSGNPEAGVWGLAYKIRKEDVVKVTDYLDYREKDGYEKTLTTFYPQSSAYQPFKLHVYIGTADNPFYLGPADTRCIAQQVYDAEGPSGKNIEYVFRLAESMRTIGPEANDSHLFELESELRRISLLYEQKPEKPS
uniref:glutathione-specific gamma-glutamylcyclotransferase n=1 Tax=Strigamia maritima TaxID=126957 RepID=T1JB24_STRMM